MSSGRWDRGRIAALAPDAAAATAAVGVARPAKWSGTGCDAETVWGECQGSGKSVYRSSAELTGPAFRCSCPSRKIPCKHVLGLLLLWSDGTVEAGARPGWVAEWLEQRRERAGRAQERKAAGPKARDPKTAERRERRVEDGLAELDQWLRDQVTHGLAQAEKAPYGLWDDAARRLVDAQAGALSGQVRALAAIPRQPGWPDRMLEEYALLRLLVQAYRRRGELPAGLRETVRSRVGFTVAQDDVLRDGERVRDRWCATGSRDSVQDQLTTRRVWLRGRETGRPALVLSFAAPGATLDSSLAVGTEVDAELAFYPGAQPLRALVAERHGPAVAAVPGGTSVAGFLDEHAAALANDPWLERWPATLERVRLARGEGGALHVVDEAGDALPLRMADPWRLLAVSGGGPVAFAGEWTPDGLRPLAAWQADEGAVLL
ncbi:SWIM zinc finger family protein [Actinomadura verrucosospora]|uniref:Zinc finger SWIM domain-containing protein n=1 Tax=Actinomadura verrucosospora TaxID=46165 RepID=A0A7D3ZKF5_ACTVE|nr:SWIM zinc finger family protein [Actinomadura verrucosospora]QKG20623.1 zinc finger SWIM domain-containing protein [Actinomadura verrucosospora]